jgi:hypothetical protein
MMRRRKFITLLGGTGPKILVAAAILCFAIVRTEAEEIRDGDTGYIANNSIWFTNESDLSVWKRVRQAFAPKDVKIYQKIILEERQAWQFISGPIKVKVLRPSRAPRVGTGAVRHISNRLECACGRCDPPVGGTFGF